MTFETNPIKDSNDELDIKDILHALINGKWIIISFTIALSIAGIIYSLLLPNIYESKALLVPVNTSSGLSGSLKNYNSLAGLAGIDLSSSDNEGISIKAKNKLSSLSFFENNILDNIFLPDLMALHSWDAKNNKIIYDESKYNKNKDIWVRNYSYPQKQKPSPQESYKKFMRDHYSLSEDKTSSFITLSIRHQSPVIAKQWTELMFNQINSFYKEKDRLESEKAVKYLNNQISVTAISEVKQVIAELLQEETQKLSLIEARKSYVFEYIDPPVVMEEESEPDKVFIFILCSLIGFMLSIAIVILRHYFTKEIL
jgi:LPS O-antigen subunit length determinant protein (WzzB/FepE family)